MRWIIIYLHEISFIIYYINYIMTEISYKNIEYANDSSLIESLGGFIKYHRLLQNKSQDQLAKEAGIVRSTLSLLERGENTSLLVFVQLLRALNLLHLLNRFEAEQQVLPEQPAKLKHSMRRRARQKKVIESKPKEDWYFY